MVSCFSKNKKNQVLRVAYPAQWRNLKPALQDNYYSSIILVNQFDPLVSMGVNGSLEPLGASSWEIDDEFKTFIFKIDTTKRFSNGDYLSSEDYKRSWEMALKEQPDSFNNSLKDVLYKVVGFDDYKKTGTISGILTPNKETLVIKFSTPFRKAIDELKGARFAAYKKIESIEIGTGDYIINQKSTDELLLTPNPYSSQFEKLSPIQINVVSIESALDYIEKGKLDIYFSSRPHESFKNAIEDESSGVGVLLGQDSTHSSINVNGMKNRIFSNPSYRKALQFLVLNGFKENRGNVYVKTPGFRTDHQIYLKLQAGRVSEQLVINKIQEGKPYVQELIDATKDNPIIFYYDDDSQWIMEKLKAEGLKFSEESRNINGMGPKLLDEVYKLHQSDLLTLGFSVSNGDPDGIYHILGKNGAIFSPMYHRSKISDLLETGRELYDPNVLDSFYQKVTLKALEEIPFIHLGFKTSIAIYKKSKINVNKVILNRNDNHLSAFQLK